MFHAERSKYGVHYVSYATKRTGLTEAAFIYLKEKGRFHLLS